MEVKCSYSEMVDPQSLVPHPLNPNKHGDKQVSMLAKILDFQGWRSPITVSNRSGYIVAGHGRLQAALKNGYEQVPIDKQDFKDEASEYSHIIADNKVANLAEHDDNMMIDTIRALDLLDLDFELLGMNDFELPKEPDPAKDEIEDDIPSDVDSRCKDGDLWILGNHTLLCGDATNVQHVDKLMGGEKAEMVFTDPPYGMSAVSKSGVLSKTYKKDIMNDHNSNVAVESYNTVQAMGYEMKQVWWGANYYSSNLPDSPCWLVWNKNNGKSDQMDAELAWTNLNGVTRMFTQASEKKDRVHPTQKPVSLVQWCLERYEYKSIIDLFGGSGSTLIACEKLDRTCYMMELDPHYCDVIIKRFEKYSGIEAKLSEPQTEFGNN